MEISVTLNKIVSDTVIWIFPVPAQSETIKVNSLAPLSDFYVYNLPEQFKKEIDDIHDFLFYSQITDWILSKFVGRLFLCLCNKEDYQKYYKFSKVSNYTLTTELVSTQNKDSVETYFKSKNLNFSSDFSKVINEYIGKNYSLVISYISADKISSKNDSKFKINILFPSENIFVPLKLNSIYGTQEISLSININNYIEAVLPEHLENFSSIDYFFNNAITLAANSTNNFFDKSCKNLKITSLYLSAPAANYKEDIVFKNFNYKFYFKQFITDHSGFIKLFFLALFSCISSMLSTVIAFNSISRKKSSFIFGLFNLMSLAGIIAASYLLNIEQKFADGSSEKHYKNNFFLKLELCFIIFLILLVSFITHYNSSMIFEKLFIDYWPEESFIKNFMSSSPVGFCIALYLILVAASKYLFIFLSDKYPKVCVSLLAALSFTCLHFFLEWNKIIFTDMGISKLPLFFQIYMNQPVIFYIFSYITILFSTFTLFKIYEKRKQTFIYLFSFIIIFHFLSFSSKLFFLFTSNLSHLYNFLP
ncbi:MAG: hypothetical protein QMC67_03295 [Candidatus Wallbacteria bacterium]